MSSTSTKTGRWPVPRRARVRVCLGRFVVVGRVVRVTVPDPPPRPAETGSWGPALLNGRIGYGHRDRRGRLVSWRPLEPY